MSTITLAEIRETQSKIELAHLELKDLNRLTRIFEAKFCRDQNRFLIPISPNEIDVVCADVSDILSSSNENNSAFQFVSLLSENITPQRRAFENSAWLDLPFESESERSQISTIFALYKNTDSIDTAFATWNISRINRIEIDRVLNVLSNSGVASELIIEYEAIDEHFTEVAGTFNSLQNNWREVLEKRTVLLLRAFSIFALSFAFPLRVGKSIFELRH